MDKLAETQYPIHELIKNRRSPLAFSGQSIEFAHLRSLLEAARWAPSSYNEQPWHFLVAVKEEHNEFARLLGCLVPGNVVWARQAAALLLSVAKLTFDANGKPNRHAFHDVGLATANLSFQATALGLALHQMGGFDATKAREEFSIPEGYEPVAAMALGYPGDAQNLPAGLRERAHTPRTRRELKEFVFTGRWGHTAPLLKDDD